MSDSLLIDPTAPAVSTPVPAIPGDVPDRAALLRLLGVPDAPDGYCIKCDHGLFESDPEMNSRLHAAGFTPEQAQLLYDLAAERLVPMIRQVAFEYEAEREVMRLVSHFGGEDAWREMSRQLLAWAKKNLPAAALDGLTTSYDGVVALHRMMTASEPAALRSAGTSQPAGDEADLHKMMRDPRYWRDRDPALLSKVTEGFRQLYPDRG
ncbi:hypothetical protein N825_17875 [Skermanella stibiiresistens SB22]|uniref:Uncharacterized protein n=1 Tax=Skermanella stibiiresistens SB22 TaxID=1385369 RepID=W9GUA0_9PROT|nr:hypothetical protein [Skermanella stibiiresistens]EWY37480.1 hypothetical protein N825_17875 [Skermanella stibiiresistens SB22]